MLCLSSDSSVFEGPERAELLGESICHELGLSPTLAVQQPFSPANNCSMHVRSWCSTEGAVSRDEAVKFASDSSVLTITNGRVARI